MDISKDNPVLRLGCLLTHNDCLLFPVGKKPVPIRPHRIKKTLAELESVLGERQIRILRELTKIHESILRFTLPEAVAYFEENEPKGEMVLVIEGKDPEQIRSEAEEEWEKISMQEHLERYLSQGLSEKDAMKQVAKDRGISKRDVYDEVKK